MPPDPKLKFLPAKITFAEFVAIKHEFNSLDFSRQTAVFPCLAISHLAIIALGRVLRMARKL